MDGPDRRDGNTNRREVVVPLRLYKTVTVISTVLSICLVVLGFVLIDSATNRGVVGRYVLEAIIDVLALARLPHGQEVRFELTAALGILGVVCIVSAGAIYLYATRFRARGMGTGKNDPSQSDDNG